MSPNKLAIAQKDSIVQRQVSTLLDIVSTLRHNVEETGAPIPNRPELDGGVKAAIDTTIIQACSRLDEMLKHKENWENDAQDEMMRAITRTHEAQQDFLKSQKEAADLVKRPSFQMRPTLVSTGNEFLAVYGDPRIAGQAIIGRGETPEAALQDFDLAFKRVPKDQLILQTEKKTKNRKNEKS